MTNLNPAAMVWLKRLRDSSNAGTPPPDIAAALTRSGAARVNGRNFVITEKGRNELRTTLPAAYAAPKKYL